MNEGANEGVAQQPDNLQASEGLSADCIWTQPESTKPSRNSISNETNGDDLQEKRSSTRKPAAIPKPGAYSSLPEPPQPECVEPSPLAGRKSVNQKPARIPSDASTSTERSLKRAAARPKAPPPPQPIGAKQSTSEASFTEEPWNRKMRQYRTERQTEDQDCKPGAERVSVTDSRTSWNRKLRPNRTGSHISDTSDRSRQDRTRDKFATLTDPEQKLTLADAQQKLTLADPQQKLTLADPQQKLTLADPQQKLTHTNGEASQRWKLESEETLSEEFHTGSTGDIESRKELEMSDSHLVEAQKVDAEAIFYAEDVQHDNFRYYMMLGAVLFVCIAAAVTTTLVLILSDDDPRTGDPICWKPMSQQDVYERCYCTNTTGDMYDELSEQGRTLYQLAYFQFVAPPITDYITVEETITNESCHPLNQIVLNFAQHEAWGLSLADLLDAPEDNSLSFSTIMSMYMLLDGIHWQRSDNWNEDSRFCSWHGVGCMFIDDFYQLKLPDNGLSGTFPAILGLASNLRFIDLARNDIYGSLPTEIANLFQLRVLDLTALQLTGAIPSEIGALDRLGVVAFQHNRFSGSLPKELFQITSLNDLSVGNNELSGRIPTEIGQGPNQLIILALNDNHFTGPLPTEIERFSNLELLNLGNNSFSGPIPDFLGKMSSLQYINLFQSGLTGALPSSFCNRRDARFSTEILLECATTPECDCCNETSNVNVRCAEDIPDVLFSDL